MRSATSHNRGCSRRDDAVTSYLRAPAASASRADRERRRALFRSDTGRRRACLAKTFRSTPLAIGEPRVLLAGRTTTQRHRPAASSRVDGGRPRRRRRSRSTQAPRSWCSASSSPPIDHGVHAVEPHGERRLVEWARDGHSSSRSGCRRRVPTSARARVGAGCQGVAHRPRRCLRRLHRQDAGPSAWSWLDGAATHLAEGS